MAERVAGRMELTYNGKTVNAVGNFTFNLGQPKREGKVGPDRFHGYSEMPQIPSCNGEIRDGSALDVTNEILNMKGATLVLETANGKKYLFEDAFYTGDGNGETEEGKFQFETQAASATELPA